MGLRDPLVSFDEKEEPQKFLTRALKAAKEAGGSGRLRLEVGPSFSLSDGTVHASVSLWVERGSGRTESWQKVSGPIMGGSYSDVLRLYAMALDADRE